MCPARAYTTLVVLVHLHYYIASLLCLCFIVGRVLFYTPTPTHKHTHTQRKGRNGGGENRKKTGGKRGKREKADENSGPHVIASS